ncbi:amidohydrolase family protein [Nocardia exalbida]|uniref:amidohydrolase family protein n=1 Tax=Nocardia exalbida TaxID=290231 RepID=UPI00030ED99C|nr:amidohydrolase family protein [Nocardia exalbida]
MNRIDVHCHYLPEFYREALVANGHSRPDGIWGIPAWTEGAALVAMDELGVTTSYLSISSPGVHFGDDAAARRLARRVNEEGARLARAHPGRFGFFASTPLPDINGALAEISYAFDELGAAGVVFETNIDGVYLGSERMAPVFEELDRRAAVLFLHPTSPAAPCTGSAPALPYPRPMLEFLFDTTRTVSDMVLSGTLERYPDLRVIVPHAGAVLPVLASRIDVIGAKSVGKIEPMRRALRRMHFDLAGMPLPEMLPALLSVADPRRLHYGSDWPFTPLHECVKSAMALSDSLLLAGSLNADVMHRNAARLFAVASTGH